MPVLFSAQLHPALSPFREELDLPDAGVLTGAALAELTRSLTDRLPLHTIARHNPNQRWWQRLALTDAVEVWLLGWHPGQSTGAHDHDGAHGAMTVVHGSMLEELFDFASGRRLGAHTHRAGRSAVFSPEHAHDMTAVTLSTTVHAYSPPLRPTRPLLGGTR